MGRTRVVGVRAIVLTDVVGSSQLRSTLGDDRADRLRRDHDAMLGSAVTAHGGQVLRWTGDGLKASFTTASASVAAAIDMQRAVTRYGRTAEAVAPFQIRIGISVGEIAAEDDDDHGVAVIEAARLEAMAAPGEILATDLVERLGQRRAEATFEPAGTHTLKGLDLPVNIVRVIDAAADAAARPVPRAVAVDGRFPLVGRGAEIEEVLGRWSEVRGGSPALVLVAGPSGIGKSRLIAQVADRAHAEGATVLAGVCDSDLAVPYQPFAVALADAEVDDDELAAAVASGVGPLGPLFPNRRTGRSDDGPAARFELFEAVVALVDRLSGDQPLVLVLEDMQWAAAPTVQLLRHLVREAPRIPVLLLVTYRGEEVGVTHPLQELFADLGQTVNPVTRLDLAPLAEAEVAELVGARVPSAPDDSVGAFARRVFDESAGSPFFVCELLHHLSSTGDLERLVKYGHGDRLPVPDSVRDVVGQRLGRLPDESGKLLAAAAVMGLTFDLELLAVVVGSDPEPVLSILEDVERVALVHEIGVGRFAFDHAIVRSTLLDRLSATRLALAHRRVADAIEQLHRPDPDELAHHWRLAGVADKANASLELAAERDLEALAYESAAERYQALIDYHQRHPDADATPLGRAWLGLGLARRALGQLDFIPAVEEAGNLGRRAHDPDLVADAAVASIWPGTYFISAGKAKVSLIELGEDALDVIGPDDPRRARILSTLASHLTFDPDRDHRIRLLEEAQTLARREGDPGLIGSVLVAEFLSLWDPSTAARRAEIAREVTRMARASGDVDHTFLAGFFGAVCAAERGDVAGARQKLGTLGDSITASQNFYYGFLSERLVLSLDILTRQPDLQGRIDELAARYGDTHADTAGTWSLQTGFLTLQAGSFETLVPTLQALSEESELAPNWTPAYGLALLAAGDDAAATDVLDRYDVPPLDYFWITNMQVLAELAVGLDRRDKAATIFERLLPFRAQLGITSSGAVCFGLVATSLGQLALTLGSYGPATELLEEAVGRADEMGAPFESAKARRLLAATYLAMGRGTAEVAPLIVDALAVAEREGFHGEAAALAALHGLVG